MSDFRFFSTHRTWEDWLGMLLGVLIVVSPWFPFQTHDIVDNERSIMILNTFVIGMLVFGLAQLEYVALQRWEEVGAIVLGCWLIASPFLFGYSGDTMLQIWHAVLGGLVVLACACSGGGAKQSVSSPSSTTRGSASDGIHKIRHVVVIMQENRSFDHYFGSFPGCSFCFSRVPWRLLR